MKFLYVCKSNFARSQMAEVFHNSITKNKEAESAGINPSIFEGKKLGSFSKQEATILVMKEAGYDISKNKSKRIKKEMVKNYDKIIVMASPEIWPKYLNNNKKVEYWDIEDPRGKSIEKFREVRDKIKIKVKNLIENLKD